MKTLLVMGATVALFAAHVTTADAQLLHNQNIIFIAGGGNPDAGFTTMLDPVHNLLLGARAKNRVNGSTPNNGAGTFTFPAGSLVPIPDRFQFNWEFSANSDPLNLGQTLNAYDYWATISGPSFGPFTFNLGLSYADNSFGTSATPNGAGAEGPFAGFASTSTVMQNSQNFVFAGADPDVNGVYGVSIFATVLGQGPDSPHFAQADILINVGTVPEPTSMSLAAIGGLSLLAFRRRK